MFSWDLWPIFRRVGISRSVLLKEIKDYIIIAFIYSFHWQARSTERYFIRTDILLSTMCTQKMTTAVLSRHHKIVLYSSSLSSNSIFTFDWNPETERLFLCHKSGLFFLRMRGPFFNYYFLIWLYVCYTHIFALHRKYRIKCLMWGFVIFLLMYSQETYREPWL